MSEVKQVLKHACKFCNKSFPCGRSLGGHMRSHLIIASSDKKLLVMAPINKNKINNNGNNNIDSAGLSYELRENPKKTWRVEESSDDQEEEDEEGDKVLPSSKALFGHMKSHSNTNTNTDTDTDTNNNNIYNYSSLVDDSSTSASNQKLEELVFDSQSDNEDSTAVAVAVAPPRANRLRRSSRRRSPRYMGSATTTSCSLSLADHNASSSFVSKIEHDQEEVALCLIMLSRGGGVGSQWWSSSTPPPNSSTVVESSENNSNLFLEMKKRSLTKGKNCTLKRPCAKADLIMSEELDDSQFSCFEGRGKMEFSASGHCKDGTKLKKLGVSDHHGYVGNFGGGIDVVEVRSSKGKTKTALFVGEFGTRSYKTDIRSKRICDDDDPLALEVKKSANSESSKRSKFECATCNKVFHSYQALGGHRASHKKIKVVCSNSLKVESCSSEYSLDAEQLSPPRPRAKLHLPLPDTKNITAQKHECSICFKVFLSGQALGGHKRSHLIAAGSDQATTSHHQPIVIQKKQVLKSQISFSILISQQLLRIMSQAMPTMLGSNHGGMSHFWASSDQSKSQHFVHLI
ncbi:hypothetical protein Dimus_024006 [Dionaea muscipula]